MSCNQVKYVLALISWVTLLTVGRIDHPPDELGGQAKSDYRHNCDERVETCSASDRWCVWKSPQGLWYDLKDFSLKQYQFGLSSPRNSVLKFHLCAHPEPAIVCRNGKKSPACISLPGVSPASTGENPKIEELEPNIPSMGINLVYENGDICEVTNFPRKTIIKLPCSKPGDGFGTEKLAGSMYPLKAFEGEKKEICHYFVEFPPSKYGCPVENGGQEVEKRQQDSTHTTFNQPPPPLHILSVTGCHDSVPAKTTKDCHFAGQVKLVIHGKNFNEHNLPIPECISDRGHSILDKEVCQKSFREKVAILVGDVECLSVKLVSFFQINCTLMNGAGKDQDVILRVRQGLSEEWIVLETFEKAVSFKERINFREKFSKFVEYGVGGLKKEINELYRRAFASRGTSPELLEQLGISHVKGILLYGPPGSGKTLLARAIGKILGSNQVSLVNAPEIISKYLGESERNLRSHFKPARDQWEEHGLDSDLFVIIIDEIDAICKPRGKSDQSSASVAYDALVNQLLTLMDGLNEMHNILVLGLTNRRELMDPALLRPGRFEIQIEVSLPDDEGRREIFDIHTRDMKKNNLLGTDVNLQELAANTTRLSGAEIAGVVRAAASYALERHQTMTDEGSSMSVGRGAGRNVVVTSKDFSRAISSLSPAYTQSKEHLFTNFMPLGYLTCGEAHGLVIDSVLDLMHVFLTSPVTPLQSLLLYGPRGSGKTTLAVHLATMGKFSFVKIVTASSLTRRQGSLKTNAIDQMFEEAYKSESSVIVLDDLTRLVEMISVGDQLHVSHQLLHTLTTHLTATPPPGTKLLMIGTMTLPSETSLDLPSSLGFPDMFNQREYVPLMKMRDIVTFVKARNIHKSEGGEFILPGNLELPVRQVLLAIDCACARSEAACGVTTPYRRSLIQEQHLVDCVMGVVNK